MMKDNILIRIGEVLANLGVDYGYVFGSFITSDDFQDVDVAISISEKLSPYETFKYSMKIARELEQNIEPRLEFDVKILNAAPVSFQYEVISKGRSVFCRDEVKRIRYEKRIIGEYLDYAPTSQWLDKRFLVEV